MHVLEESTSVSHILNIVIRKNKNNSDCIYSMYYFVYFRLTIMGLLAQRHPKVHVFPSFLAVLLEKKDFTKWLYPKVNSI